MFLETYPAVLEYIKTCKMIGGKLYDYNYVFSVQSLRIAALPVYKAVRSFATSILHNKF